MSIRFEEMIAVNAEKKGIFFKRKKKKRKIYHCKGRTITKARCALMI